LGLRITVCDTHGNTGGYSVGKSFCPCYNEAVENLTFYFILLCLLAQASFWIINGFSTKKTVENRGGWTMRIIALMVAFSVIFLRKQIAIILPVADDYFYPFSLAVGIGADIVVLLGVVVMIWARIALGKNWSANVTFKADHELISHGPYAYVRHPIYSGLLLVVLGLVIYSGSVAGYFFFFIFFGGAYYKALKEEKVLTAHFGEKYLQYKKEVRALIPFIF